MKLLCFICLFGPDPFVLDPLLATVRNRRKSRSRTGKSRNTLQKRAFRTSFWSVLQLFPGGERDLGSLSGAKIGKLRTGVGPLLTHLQMALGHVGKQYHAF